MSDSETEIVSDMVSLMVDDVAQAEADGADVFAMAGPSQDSNAVEPGDWTCAICLDVVPTAELAVVKGCGHSYCVNCIVHWASTRTADPRCPTCKAPFTQLMCHKKLDGSFSSDVVEESVVLLARSSHFQNWLAERERGKHLSRSNPGLALPPAAQQPVPRSEEALLQEEWAEEALYGYFESQYDDDDEFEDLYLSRGPRMAIGNRPNGPNGFMAAGRKLAAPKRAKGKGGEAGPSSKANAATSNKGNAATSSKQQATGGRRAQRKAKRAAAEAGGCM